MTPRLSIFMRTFWFYGRFSEAMSFSIFATSVSKVTIAIRKFSIVWLPQVKCLLLLWKTKPTWIKRNSHNVILQCYNPRKALKEIPPYLNRDFWYKMNHILKMTLLQKNGYRIKMPSSKSLILVSFCWNKNFLRIYALTNLIYNVVPNFFEISDCRCCILSGPPCI